MCQEYRLKEHSIQLATWVFLKAGFMLLDRNHEMSLDKIRGLGFTKELPVGHGYFKAFDHMVQEKILPSFK